MVKHFGNLPLFVCLFEIQYYICPAVSTLEEGPTESTTPSQATHHPLAYAFLWAPYPLQYLWCILHQEWTLPCPSNQYRYPTKYLVLITYMHTTLNS